MPVLKIRDEKNKKWYKIGIVGGGVSSADIYKHIGGLDIPIIDTDAIADECIEIAKIANAAVVAGKIAEGAVTEEKIANLAITVGKIADQAVETEKIANLAVEEAQIGAGAATEAKIAVNAITVTKIADNAIETPKIKAGAVETAKIAAEAVEADQIAAGAIVAVKIGAGAITTDKLDALAVTAEKIGALAVTTGKLDALAVTAVKIAANAIETAKIKAGAVEAGKIATGAITTIKLGALQVTAEKIAALTITAGKIAANTITAGQIAAHTITSDEIKVGTITADEIFANTITIGEIKVGTILLEMYTDFHSNGADANDPWSGTAFGGGCVPINGTVNHPGIARLTSETINSGYRFMTVTGCIIISGSDQSEFIFRVTTILPNIRVRLGYQDSTGTSLPTDGVWIDLTGATLTGKTSNNSSRSTTSTSYGLSQNTWYRAKIAVNDAATSVTFTLHNAAGSQLWTRDLTSNIPTGRACGHGIVMYCASSVARSFDIDMMMSTHSKELTR